MLTSGYQSPIRLYHINILSNFHNDFHSWMKTKPRLKVNVVFIIQRDSNFPLNYSTFLLLKERKKCAKCHTHKKPAKKVTFHGKREENKPQQATILIILSGSSPKCETDSGRLWTTKFNPTMHPTSILWLLITFCTIPPNVRAVNHWIISVDGKIQPKVSHTLDLFRPLATITCGVRLDYLFLRLTHHSFCADRTIWLHSYAKVNTFNW